MHAITSILTDMAVMLTKFSVWQYHLDKLCHDGLISMTSALIQRTTKVASTRIGSMDW